MALLEKVVQGDGSWRLRDLETGEWVGRVAATTHVDRLVRDSQLAQDVAAALALSGAARRTAVRTALSTWTAAGGRSVDLSTLAQTVPGDGNTHLLVGGADAGYVHGEVYNTARLLRFVRLAEEAFAAEQLGTSALRNQALDGAIDRFRDGGGTDRAARG